jgi:hypothetical protein
MSGSYLQGASSWQRLVKRAAPCSTTGLESRQALQHLWSRMRFWCDIGLQASSIGISTPIIQRIALDRM